MSKSYYVKARGRVAGPFPVDRLQAMARQGQLSRIHDVSTDGKKWQKASQFSELFQVDQPAAKPTTETGGHATAKRKKRRRSAEADDNTSLPPAEKGGWHYGINGQTAGPVAESVIVDLIRRGKLTVRDRVWKATFDDWKTVGELPQLAVLLPGDGPSGQSSGSHALNQTNDDQANDVDWNVHRGEIAKSLAAIVPWVYFVCILVALYCFGMLYAFITTLVAAYRLNDAAMVGGAIGILIGIAVVASGGYFLQRFGSFSSKYALIGNTAFLRDAMLWLKRFWLLIGITLALSIIISMVMYAYVLATTGNNLGI